MNKYKPAVIFKLQLILVGFICSFSVRALSPEIQQTHHKLNALNLQISNLQHNLTLAHNKKELLHNELAKTEKNISQGVQTLHQLEINLNSVSSKITQLEKRSQRFAEQLHSQQLLLAAHARARYAISSNQPLKWFLKPNAMETNNRLLIYYHYLIESRERSISKIHDIQNDINKNKKNLDIEVVAKKTLIEKLNSNQKLLSQSRNYHNALISSLENQIQKHQINLNDAKKDKINLAELLKKLAQQRVKQPKIPFAKMQRKLPYPLKSNAQNSKSMNQGVTFFAEEGTPVTAVSPGTVVFSDWLKGYGLLIIIDHGAGFMTLYAHNESLFKNKGDSVSLNDQIASVGHSGGIKENGLYFEIRLKGKAIPPLTWLA